MGQTRGQFWKLAITHPSSIEWHGGGLLASLRPENSESPGLALPSPTLVSSFWVLVGTIFNVPTALGLEQKKPGAGSDPRTSLEDNELIEWAQLYS